MGEVIRIKQYEYVHLLDSNTNVTRCMVGPVVYTRRDHEKLLFPPKACISIPPRCFCWVKNPCERGPDQLPLLDTNGQVRLRAGDLEVRFEQDPFPLMPGEELVIQEGSPAVSKLAIVAANSAYHVRCVREFVDEKQLLVRPGTEWLIEGPRTFHPRVEVQFVGEVTAHIVKPNTALRLRAVTRLTDRSGTVREAGEVWLVRHEGAYLPGVYEEVVETVNGIVLTDREAIHLSASHHFVDVYGVTRMAGDEWLVSNQHAAVHIPDVYEEVKAIVRATTLGVQDYCVIADPMGPTGINRYGEKEVRRGECSFFLHPGERLVDAVRPVKVLGRDEALLLKAMDTVVDGAVTRVPGEKWMVYGPSEYIPHVCVQICEYRQMIALDKNEGVYVMDLNTGIVRAVIGKAYMLNEHERLWDKAIPPEVEYLLASPNGTRKTSDPPPATNARVKHRVVRFNVQHNAAVQIYDYKANCPRIVFGPNLVILSPDEEFTVLSLSGGKPKMPNALQSLQLYLGPRFSSDTVIVETSDHARLQLRLSYNWFFDVDRSRPDAKIFSVPDFVGDCCKTIASRVRGAVAAVDFDSFHRNSSKIIRTAVFGVDDHGATRTKLRFEANNLVVTNIDIQSVEPRDAKTRDSLQKSVQLAIEITTKSQEAAARHGNERKDQEAKGRLERQKLQDKIEVEVAKTKWLELHAQSKAIQATGQAVAEAKARAEALLIAARAELKQANLSAEAYRIAAEAELQQLKAKQEAEIAYARRLNAMEIEKEKDMAESEGQKLRDMIDAIGRETLVTMAQAGPEMQAKLLGGLGLKGYLITDGASPINLFQTAQGMLGSGAKGHLDPNGGPSPLVPTVETGGATR